jgi:hypothetical protein
MMTPSLMRRSAVALLVVASVGGIGSVARADDKPPKQAAPKTLEEMLKETGFAYSRPKEGLYRVAVESGGEVSMIVVEERTMSWKSRDGSPTKVAVLYTQVTPTLPREFKIPPAMLMRLAELNDKFTFGSLSVGGSGERVVFYNASFFLRNADSEMLYEYLTLAHSSRTSSRKELLPFLQDASGN